MKNNKIQNTTTNDTPKIMPRTLRNDTRMSRTRSQEITGPGGSKTQKIWSQTTKSRKQDGIREKSTPKSHKKHGPDVQKTPPHKNPLF